jgi:hypothetical protein
MWPNCSPAPGVDKVSFAGPVSVGSGRRRVRRDVQIPQPDMGGKSAAIVLEDADLVATSAALGRLASPTRAGVFRRLPGAGAPVPHEETVTGLMEQAAPW